MSQNKSINKRTEDMLEGTVGPTLLKLTLPMIVGLLSVLLINLVDTFYIGQLGLIELASVSFTFPVVFVVWSIAFGIGIGTSSVVARAIGQGNHPEVKILTTASLYLTFLVMGIVGVVGVMTINPVFTMLGASPDMMPLIRDYMVIWFLGYPLVALPMVGNNAIRATGDSKTPSMVMMGLAIVNAILDPFFIFGIGPFPMMGVKGAAIATVISYFFALVAGFWVLGKREKMLEIKFPSFEKLFSSWSRILYIATPAAFANVLAPLASAVLTRIISSYGADAVAAFGIGTRIEAVAMLGVMALTAILTPFIAQNLGARNLGRIREALTYSSKFSHVWGLLVAFLLAVSAYPIASIFSDDTGVQYLSRAYLWILPISFGFMGLSMIASSACNGLNRPFESFVVQIFRLFILIVPLAMIGSWRFGILGVFGGIFVGNLISGVVSTTWVKFSVFIKTEKLIEKSIPMQEIEQK